MTENHGLENLVAPNEAAKSLGISVATLRKYSLIVEDVVQDDDYFSRTKQNTRLYTEQNLTDIKDFAELSKTSSLTLKEAANQIFVVKTKKSSAEVPLTIEETETSEMAQLMASLQATITKQNKAIDTLQKEMATIKSQNQELLSKADEPKEVKKPVAQPTPKVEEVEVEEVFADDLPDMEEVAKAQEEQDLAKADPRGRILARAQENFDEGKTPEHRTLADMQLKDEKEHWWNRFRN